MLIRKDSGQMSYEVARVPFELTRVAKAKNEDDEPVGVIAGMASTFGNVDLHGDVIEQGAFKGSFKRVSDVKLLWQHDPGQPIGVWKKITETDRGLEVEGELVLGVRQADEAFMLMKAGAVDALSIGFRIPPEGSSYDDRRGKRNIHKVELWEVSVVTFPANPKARIGSVKDLGPDALRTKRSVEDALRDAGFSRATSTYLASRFSEPAQRDAGGKDEQVAKTLLELRDGLRGARSTARSLLP